MRILYAAGTMLICFIFTGLCMWKWHVFIAVTIFATPIIVGAAYDGWFGAIIGGFISFLLFRKMSKDLAYPRKRF